MNDHMTEELQIAMDAIEAQQDPDDTELHAYARAMNRVQGDEDAINARYEAERDKLDANRDKMLKACENVRAGIEWKWGQMVREILFARQLNGMKQKFVDTLFGRLGTRTIPSKTKRIFRHGCDKKTALEWAKEKFPTAVSTRTSESVVIGDLPPDCPQIWVEDVPAEEKFYWRPNKKQEKTNE